MSESLHENDTKDGLKEAQNLFKRNLVSKNKSALLWADGYVDYTREAIARRDSPKGYVPMERMNELGKRINEASRGSLSIEWTVKEKKPGGFCSNTGWALEKMQVPTTLISFYGSPRINPVFEDIVKVCREVISIGKPGETQAIEFKDGKVMLVDPGGPLKLSWKKILSKLGREKLIEYIEKADLFGQGYWSLIPRMNEIWKRLQEEIFPNLSADKERYMFLDLADMGKRSKKELVEALDLMSQFENYFDVTLSLNELEAKFLANTLKVRWGGKSRNNALTSVGGMESKIGISNLIVHTVSFAISASPEDKVLVNHPYDPNPKIITAAGDHFNAGYIFGILNNLTTQGRLIIGCSNAGFFVRNNLTPSLEEIHNFLKYYEARFCSVVGDKRR